MKQKKISDFKYKYHFITKYLESGNLAMLVVSPLLIIFCLYAITLGTKGYYPFIFLAIITFFFFIGLRMLRNKWKEYNEKYPNEVEV